jgi:hypothetical protein
MKEIVEKRQKCRTDSIKKIQQPNILRTEIEFTE